MLKASCHLFNWRNAVFILVAALTIFLDQSSKSWIRDSLFEGQILFQAGFFRIVHVHNSGAAFGIFQGFSTILMFIAMAGAIIVLAITIFAHHQIPFLDTWLGKAVLGLTMGGILGNLIDRIRFGYVTDFIDLTYWPVFNVADSAVSVSAVIFAIFLLYQTITEKQQDER